MWPAFARESRVPQGLEREAWAVPHTYIVPDEAVTGGGALSTGW